MVTISGPDRPGILATLCKILTRHRAEIRDIGQMSLRDMLGLYFLLDLQDARDSGDGVIKDLLFAAYQLNLDLRFQPFTPDSLSSVGRSNLFIITHFGGTGALTELSKILGDEEVNIENITCHEHHGVKSMDMILNVDRVSSLSQMKQRLMLKSRELGVNLAIQKMEAYRKNKRLIFFDMDSTLLDMEVIDELAGLAGVSREVARVTKKAMRGDYDFEESLVQRVALAQRAHDCGSRRYQIQSDTFGRCGGAHDHPQVVGLQDRYHHRRLRFFLRSPEEKDSDLTLPTPIGWRLRMVHWQVVS